MCLSTQLHGSFGDDCQISGIRHDVSQSRQKKNSAAQVSFLLTTAVAKSQMLLRILHGKSFRYCKSKYFSHFRRYFLKLGWSFFLNPFTSKLAPKKNRSSSFSQTISRFFPLDFNRGGTIPQQPSDASNHPRGAENKMRSCDVKVFRVVFIFFGCEDRTDEVVSEIFWTFHSDPWGRSHIFFRWMAQSPSRRSWLAIFCSPADRLSQVGVSRAFFAEMIE